MDSIIIAVLETLLAIIGFYVWIVFGAVIVSWLINFQVINTQNRFVYAIVDILYRMTEPVFNLIRRVLPFTVIGGLDLSPIVLLFGLFFLQSFLTQLLYSV